MRPDEDLAHVAQHVVLVLFGRVGQAHGQHAEQGGADDHVQHHRPHRAPGGDEDRWLLQRRPRVQLEHAGAAGGHFHARQGENHAHEGGPVADDASAGRLRMELGDMRRPAGNEHHHHHDRGHGQPDGDAAGVLGPKKVNRPDDKDGGDRPLLGRRRFLKAEVVKSVQATQGGGDDEIRQQEQPANGGQPPRMQAGGRIDAAAVGEVLADPNVVNANQAGQRADGQQVRQRRETHRRDRQADDIGFAGAPIAVEQRGSPHPAHIARAPNGADFHGAGLRAA